MLERKEEANYHDSSVGCHLSQSMYLHLGLWWAEPSQDIPSPLRLSHVMVLGMFATVTVGVTCF